MNDLRVTREGVPKPHLEGKWYFCIWDEATEQYNALLPHFHKIQEAYYIYAPGYIYHGLALVLQGHAIPDRSFILGCDERYVVSLLAKNGKNKA